MTAGSAQQLGWCALFFPISRDQDNERFRDIICVCRTSVRDVNAFGQAGAWGYKGWLCSSPVPFPMGSRVPTLVRRVLWLHRGTKCQHKSAFCLPEEETLQCLVQVGAGWGP